MFAYFQTANPADLLTPPRGAMTHTQAAEQLARDIVTGAGLRAAELLPQESPEKQRCFVLDGLRRARLMLESAIDDAAKLRQGLPVDFHDHLGAGR